MSITTASELAPHARTSADTAIPRAIVIAGRLGCVLFGIPMVIFGVQHYMYAGFVVTLIPAWIPARLFWTWFTGAALVAAGAAILANRMARLAATLLGVMIFLFFLLVHTPAVLGRPEDADQWTYLTQAFTFSGIAYLVAVAMPPPGSWPSHGAMTRILALGRAQITIGFVVLGVRQLLQFPFVHRLVPAWAPGQTFWALLAGVLLVATGVGATMKRERIPALALAALLLLFLVGHHVPALVSNPRNVDWGAACKDSILCGGALVLARARSLGDNG